MKKVYAIHQRQKELVEKLCFPAEECGKILVGEVHDETIGSCYVCDEKNCPYEKKNMEYGEIDNAIVWLRILEEL